MYRIARETMGAGDSQTVKVIDKPVGFKYNINVAGALRVEVVQYHTVKSCIRQLS